MANAPFKIRLPPSGPIAQNMTPGYVLTVQSDGEHIAPEPGGSGPGAGVKSWNTRTGDVVPEAGDYDASQVTYGSETVAAALDEIDDAIATFGAVDCVAVGVAAFAEGDRSIATGYGAHAEGSQTLAGQPLLTCSLTPDGVLVTVPGNVLGQFDNGAIVRVTPTTPTAKPTVTRTIVTAPAFAAGNTTFNLDALVDALSTDGTIAQQVEIPPGRGIASHAEGFTTISQGWGSHSEGVTTGAFGPAAHAEGAYTKAYGDDSHAEGETTIAGGIDSHAEGGSTVALGFCAHAEGGAGATPGPMASGDSSHAEGVDGRTGYPPRAFSIPANGVTVTIVGNVVNEFRVGDRIPFVPQQPTDQDVIYAVVGTQPVFGGVNTTFDLTTTLANTPLVNNPSAAAAVTGGLVADGQFAKGAHSEGATSIALGFASHAEGGQTLASGDRSHAEGHSTIASGADSHAEGQSTLARDINSHAEGDATTASARAAHSEGTSTRAGNMPCVFTIAANGTTVTIAGDHTTEFVSGNSVAIDPTAPVNALRLVRTVTSVPAFASGNTTFTLSSALDSYTTGGTIVDPNFGASAHAEGQNTIATGIAAHVEGFGNSATADHAHAEGQNNVATAAAAHAEGLNTIAGGVGAHAEGNTTVASGARAHAEGNVCTASGQSAHAEGNGTTASNTAAHAEGDSTVASGVRAHAEGISCQARNDNAHAEGQDCFADGVNSHAQGFQSQAFSFNEHAEAGGQFAARGDNQYRRVQLKASTPGVSPGETAVLLTGGAIVNFLRNSTAYLITVRSVATVTGLGAAARQTAAFGFCVVASVTSGGAVTLSAVSNLFPPIVQGAGLVGATLTPSTGGNNDLTLTLAIAAGLTTPARITATVEYVELLGN